MNLIARRWLGSQTLSNVTILPSGLRRRFNDLKSETYFARLIISAENELHARKIIELDGRPSDCIALAVQQAAPIYVAGEVWDEVEDRTDILKKMEEQGEG